MLTPRKRAAMEVSDAAGLVQRCDEPRRITLYVAALNDAVATLNAELWSDEQIAAELRKADTS